MSETTINITQQVERVSVSASVGEVVNIDVTTTPVIVEVVVSEIGQKGDKGEAGGNYTHSQDIPSTTWNITHSLGFYPGVTVVDSANSVVEGGVQYIDENSLTLSFSAAFGGKAYLS